MRVLQPAPQKRPPGYDPCFRGLTRYEGTATPAALSRVWAALDSFRGLTRYEGTATKLWDKCGEGCSRFQRIDPL